MYGNVRFSFMAYVARFSIIKHFKMEGQGRREHLEEKKISFKTMMALLHKEKWPTLFILEPEHRALSFSPSRLLHTDLQNNDSYSSLYGLVREQESWPASQVSQKNGTAVS